jgi:Protein of unknown function (DUF4229)
VRPVLVYSASRLALFAAVAGVLYLVGARSFLLLVLAFLISGLIAWPLLGRQRDQMARTVEQRVSRTRSAMTERTAAEDAADDARRAAEEGPQP